MRLKKDLDYILITAVVLLIILGLVILYSASYQKQWTSGRNFVLRQILWVGIGVIFLCSTTLLNYRKLVDFSYVLYGINLLMLALVFVPGIGSGLYAHRWLGYGGIYIQPSEFAKLTVILVLARYLGLDVANIKHPRSLFLPLVLVSLPMVLILIQPDLGTALIFIPIMLSMLYVAEVRLKHLMVMIGLGLISAPFLGYLLYKWHVIKDYQVHRLLVFIKPDFEPLGAGYTITQSKISIGSGGMFGKGWLAGTQNQLNFLPERHTDFIFSVVGEEWGFIGSCLLLILYYIIISRGLIIALRVNNIVGRLTAMGLVTMIVSHVIINTGMAIGIMPVVGLALPLVSYGGSSVVTTMIAIGILLNIRLQRNIF